MITIGAKNKELKKKISDIVKALPYKKNIGYQEMMEFYKVATPRQIELMERSLDVEDWVKFKKLIKQVLNVSLLYYPFFPFHQSPTDSRPYCFTYRNIKFRSYQ